MAFIVADRVKETTLTSGTGSIVLNGAFSGFQTFASGIGNGNSTYYVIENKTNWEVGIGTYSSAGNSLSRDTVLRSSAGGSKISLTGVSNVFCSYPATKSVHANPENFINVVAYSGVKFADATLTNSGAYFTNIVSSGNLTLQPQAQDTVPLNIVRTSSGVFFHAYKDDAYDRPVALHTNGNLSPEWRLGLKSTPNNVYEAPSFGYVYGEDGKVGLFGNNATKLDLLNTSGLYVTHQSNVALKVTSNTGIYVNSLGNAYPALSVNGGPSLSAPILSLNNYAGSVLTVVDPQGRVGVKTASPAYDLDVNGSGRFNVVHPTSGISFSDGSFQNSAGKTYSAGSGLVLVDTTFHALATVTSGDIAALVASGIAISGWNKGYTDASVAAVSGWTGTEYVSLHGTYNNPSWLNSISVAKLSGVVDSNNLPSYVDDVVEYSTSGNFPVTGETGKIYVSTDNNRSYRWSGSAYFQLTDTTALWGEITGDIVNQTDLTAYVSSVSGWNKSYTDASVAAVSGWNKGYTDNSAVAVSGWNKNYTDSQLLAASGYSSGNYVPYIGATQNVDLGSRTLSAGSGTFTGLLSGTTATFTGAVRLPTDNTGIYFSATGNSHGRISTFANDFYIDLASGGNVIFRTNAATHTNLQLYGNSNPVSLEITGGSLSLGTSTYLTFDAADTLAQRRSTNAQTFRLYGTYTDASNYRRLYVSSTTAGAFTLGVQGAGTGASGNTLTINNDLFCTGSLAVNTIGSNGNGNVFFGYAPARRGMAIDDSGYYFKHIDTGRFEWSSTANVNSATDLTITRNAAGQLDVRGNSGLRVRNYANSAFAKLFAGDEIRSDAPSGEVNYLTFFVNGSERGRFFSDATNQFGYTFNTGTGSPAYFTLRAQNGGTASNHAISFINATEIWSEGTNTIAIRRGTNAQRFNLYGTYTDASNYRRLYLSSTTAGAFTIGVEGAGTGASGNTLTVASNTSFSGQIKVATGDRYTPSIQYSGAGPGNGIAFTGSQMQFIDNNSVIAYFGQNSAGQFVVSTPTTISSSFTITQPVSTSGSPTAFTLTGAAHTTLTASTEATDVNFNLARTVQFAAGNITTQRAFRIQAPTYSFASASTITTASTLSINGAPVAGTNATITNRWALNVESGDSYFGGAVRTSDLGPTNGNRVSIANQLWQFSMNGQDDISFTQQGGTDSWGVCVRLGGYSAGALPFGDVKWVRDAANIWGQRVGTNSQTLRIYNTFTDASNYIRQSLSFTTYSSTVHAQLGAEGAGTGAVNIPFVITPRGTGAFILGPMPDGTTTGGNARGANAIDLQTTRSAATQVASDFGVAIGTACTVSGGTGSVAIGRNVNVSDSLGGAVGIGRNVTVTGYRSIGIGSGATTGADSVAIGTGATASNNYAICVGTFTVSRWDGYISWRANNWIASSNTPDYNNNISGAGVQNAIKAFRTVNSTPALIESSIVTSFVGSRFRHKGALIFAKAVVVAIRSDGAINKYERRIAIKDLASVDGSTSTMSVLSSETIGTDILEMPHLNIAITAVSKSLRITVTGEQEYAVTGNSTTDVITATGHPFANDDIVVFNSLTGGSGLTTNPNGQYYFGIYKVINVSGNTFQLAATGSGSTPIDFTTDITAGAICRPILWYTNPIEFFVAAGAY